MDFEEVSSMKISPKDMSEALLKIQSDIKPTTKPFKGTRKYTISEDGQKKRNDDKESKATKQRKSKNQRKSDRA